MPIKRTVPVDTVKYVFIFTDRKILVKKNTLILPNNVSVLRDLYNNAAITKWIYEDNFDYVAAFLQSEDNIPNGYELILVVDIFAQYNIDATITARARSLLFWTESMHYCSVCGNELIDAEDETAIDCKKCNVRRYPSFSPAIIVLVTKGDKILLAKHAQRATTVYTCLAGYVEQGETIEECVVREVFEEVALNVKNVRYIKSQSWPFPNQLMLGFTCEWESGEIKIDKNELSEADWYDRDNLPDIPSYGTIARYLIDGKYKEKY